MIPLAALVSFVMIDAVLSYLVPVAVSFCEASSSSTSGVDVAGGMGDGTGFGVVLTVLFLHTGGLSSIVDGVIRGS